MGQIKCNAKINISYFKIEGGRTSGPTKPNIYVSLSLSLSLSLFLLSVSLPLSYPCLIPCLNQSCDACLSLPTE